MRLIGILITTMNLAGIISRCEIINVLELIYINSSILNVPRSASNDLIKDRYKQLAIIFHPDKQRTDQQKESAAAQFSHIKQAYEGSLLFQLSISA